MLKSFRVRLIVILAALGIAIGYYVTEGLKLGLDLQGGMHLVLEIDDPDGTLTPEAKASAIERAERIIRTRVDEFGVEEPLIQRSGSDRIIVELAGLDDESRAKEIINQQAFLEWKLVLSNADVDQALERLDRAVVVALGAETLREMGRDTEAGEAGASSIEQLLFNTSDSVQADDSAAADNPEAEADPADAVPEDEATAEDEAGDEVGEVNFRPFSGLLNTGEVGTYLVDAEDIDDATAFMALPEFQRALPRGVSLQWGWDSIPRAGRFYRELYVLEEDAFLTGDQLDDATANRDQQFNQPQVLFELNRRGGRDFQRLTAANIGNRIAIVLDGEVVSAPVVRDRIGARGTIDLGSADMSEATDLALVLRAGALPAPLSIMEERTVGPSLGADSIEQGQMAGIVGVIAVLVIMMVYYRMAGILAVAALAIYLMLVLGGLSALNATLTLPGIAGLILSIGMAVDANVLIFERIREELERRRAPRTAVDEGFGNALSAIVDANITTLITGLILFQFGTGPVRGFAVTLCIGIVASFFSALYVTRTLFLIYLTRKRGSDPISI
ncbi:MAG: protein translocase subunit SecD [Gemmatimonadota bacterium]|nr:protein translocase subunit SecD [Gemmatimonadota bacterium]MDE2866865.1 protein translocase subunit SecD [Gemmatimonadota bacterium]MXV94403.1 protein translocase subunit SecD [Gemmatimonadota bacterium]MYB06084.1 protein translocase subunit SecD [Gemmatimonadota bacterium]MYE15798.1 protein translocase subunit SecD [Gemmatimonadota bacterium]